MTEREALKRSIDRLHADHVELKRELDEHGRGLATCRRLMAEVTRERAVLLHRYQELVRAQLGKK